MKYIQYLDEWVSHEYTDSGSMIMLDDRVSFNRCVEIAEQMNGDGRPMYTACTIHEGPMVGLSKQVGGVYRI